MSLRCNSQCSGFFCCIVCYKNENSDTNAINSTIASAFIIAIPIASAIPPLSSMLQHWPAGDGEFESPFSLLKVQNSQNTDGTKFEQKNMNLVIYTRRYLLNLGIISNKKNIFYYRCHAIPKELMAPLDRFLDTKAFTPR